MKSCSLCKGLVGERRVEHIHHWKGSFYVLRNVPAEVCTQCGEVFFGPQALKAMDEIVMAKGEPEEHRSVPVYSL